jgi:hypothetical protein
LSFAGLQVLLDVERRDGVRHEGDGLGIAAPVTEGEGDGRSPFPFRLRGPDLELDVAPHAFDRFFVRGLLGRSE